MKMKGFKCVKLQKCREKHDFAATECTEHLGVDLGKNKALLSITSLLKLKILIKST